MVENGGKDSAPPLARAIGRSFRRIGGFGFWTQLCVGIIPIIVFAIVFGSMRGFAPPGGRLGLLGWFSLISVLLLAFTTFWSWRYRAIGRRLETGAADFDPAALTRTVWTGLGASSLGIALSLIVVLTEVIYLFLVFMEAPQGGAPVFQTMEGSGLSWITALDVLSLLALILTAAVEVITLLLALWLLYRLSTPREVPIEAVMDAMRDEDA